MAHWQRKIMLNPEWDQAYEGELTIAHLARSVAAKLKSLAPFNIDEFDEERDELVEEFEALAGDAGATTPEFDDAMRRLFDWGDRSLDRNWNGKKVCWIDTMSVVKQSPTKRLAAE